MTFSSVVDTVKSVFSAEPPAVTPEQVATTTQAGTELLTALTAEADMQNAIRLARLREANEAHERLARIQHRASTLQSALTQLKDLGQLNHATAWRDFLRSTRQEFTDALLSPDASFASRRDLMLSIRVIDQGPHSLHFENVALVDLQLADAVRNAGVTWQGTLPEAERRVAELTKQRDDAMSTINQALTERTDR